MATMYTNGTFHSANVNNASTMMQAFNYGTAAFEGMKAFYDGAGKEWLLFRPDQHLARLKRSAAVINIDFKMTVGEYVGIVSKLLRKNCFASDVYIRPLVYRSEPGVGMARPSGHGVSIFIQPSSPPSPDRLRCCIVPQRRPTDGSYSVKLAGNYVLSFLSHQYAVAQEYDTGILLSVDGYLSEASVMNLFFVRDGELFTPSLACGALDGITRKSVIELARRTLGIRVHEGKYRPSRLEEADELFFTGTGSGIRAASQLGRRRVKTEGKGAICSQLRETYGDVVHGKLRGYEEWTVRV